MSAKIITIVNQKGGSGKTTVAMQLGGTLALRNAKTLIVDGDKQNSAVEWASMAEESQPFPACVFNLSASGNKIHQEIKKYRHDYEYILIDCPPAADSPISTSTLLVSDLALIPFIPDGVNMSAAVKIRDAIENARIINESLLSMLVLNRVETKTIVTHEVLALLPDFNMTTMQTILHKRTHYAESFFIGGTVHALKNKAKRAVTEIEQLADEVQNTLKYLNTTIGNATYEKQV